VRLSEQENCAAVDLFDTRHARHILCEFGHAYGALPESVEDLHGRTQQEFLDRGDCGTDRERPGDLCAPGALCHTCIRNPAVDERYAGGGRRRARGGDPVPGGCVRLAVITVVVSHVPRRPQGRAALAHPGSRHGDQGLYSYRRRNWRTSRVSIVEVTNFHRLIQILEEETRLLTPVDAVEDRTASGRTVPGESSAQAYQLTHDYLVPSIREWLTQRQTRNLAWPVRTEARGARGALERAARAKAVCRHRGR